MSANVKIDGSGIMWQSEDDLLKDLAFLSDFGSSANSEPHRILYSTGRGLKFKERRSSQEKFIDPRTGDVVDINALELNCDEGLWKGKGRGHLGSYAIKKFQLQEQLRLARPLGSGDEAMESYCRRNRPRGNSTGTSDSDVDSLCTRTDDKSSSESDKPPPRVKGSRNSVVQGNALINALLSKDKANSEVFNDGSNTEDDDSGKSNSNDSSNDIALNRFTENSRNGRLKTTYGKIREEKRRGDGERKSRFESDSCAFGGEAKDCLRNCENLLTAVDKLNSKMNKIYNFGSDASTRSFYFEYGEDFPPLPSGKP